MCFHNVTAELHSNTTCCMPCWPLINSVKEVINVDKTRHRLQSCGVPWLPRFFAKALPTSESAGLNIPFVNCDLTVRSLAACDTALRSRFDRREWRPFNQARS
jgi:hypothetical protein